MDTVVVELTSTNHRSPGAILGLLRKMDEVTRTSARGHEVNIIIDVDNNDGGSGDVSTKLAKTVEASGILSCCGLLCWRSESPPPPP
mmetsp:Transcript_925/g.2072  ORF Transcript_925/g.2072 Transcript_925/m.2072 type:complete len:87 (-) Transcript_925:50-310(-)